MVVYPYFEFAPEGFVDSADVILEVEGQRLPAHSQFLASQSRFMDNMVKDLGGNFSRSEQIIVPASMLSNYKAQDVQAFLCQVYSFSSKPPNSAEEAYHLFHLADLFDSPKLMKGCVDYLDAQPNGMFKATTDGEGVLKWAVLAERFGFRDLGQRAIKYIAENYVVLESDARLSDLSTASLLMLTQCLQAVVISRAGPHVSSYNRCSKYIQYCSRNTCPGHNWENYVGSRQEVIGCDGKEVLQKGM